MYKRLGYPSNVFCFIKAIYIHGYLNNDKNH